MKRIVDTLDTRSKLYRATITALQEAIYDYEPRDLKTVHEKLEEGLIGRESKKYSPAEITKLRQLPQWATMVGCFLQKKIHST